MAGLPTRDVDLEHGEVRYVRDRHRDIKTGDQGYRTVPLGPQLRLALTDYLERYHRPARRV